MRAGSALVVTAVALSFFIMIVAGSISGGYRAGIRSAISDYAGDILLSVPGSDYVSGSAPTVFPDGLADTLCSLKGVSSVRPAIWRGGIVKGEESIQGVLLKAEDGNGLEDLQADIPQELSRRMGLKAGDDMTVYFVGEKLKVRKFEVVGVHESIVTANDYPLVKVSPEALRRLAGWDEGNCSALQVFLDASCDSPSDISEAAFEVGAVAAGRFSVTSIAQKYPELFSWLELIDFNVRIILLLMTLVAGFNMISGLLIILLRNISLIGLLKSMGMTDKGISAVFLRLASRLVLMGMAVGNALALVFCILQKNTHFLKLDPSNYFLPFVPVDIDFPSIVLTDIAAYAVIMLLMWLPSRFISKVDPAITVREQ